MYKVVLKGIKEKHSIWDSDGSSVYVTDKKKGINFSISIQTLIHYLGKSYNSYLNFQFVTIYYDLCENREVKIYGITHENPYWVYYGNEEKVIENSGKWMHFFSKDNYQFVKDICKKAINQGIVEICKHTAFEDESVVNPHSKNDRTGVICFYINGYDEDEHKHLIKFFIDNNLIQKTKTGKLYNISFKFDYQTLTREYGDEFKGKIRLSDYVDLESGEFL